MDIERLRRRYAEKTCELAAIHSPALADAFAVVPRERFLGPGPWRVVHLRSRHGGSYETTPDGRLEHIYDDVLVAIDEARRLNNGQPSAHALWIDAAAPRPGESVLHIGCGTGYYTAIFAEMVGGSGRVVGVEIDPDLAERARVCLAPWPQARVVTGDGGSPEGPHDVIYVNAGATHARREWLSALAPKGRLVLPLTLSLSLPPAGHGTGILIRAERVGTHWPVRVVSRVGIYDCQGARDEAAEAQLRKLLRRGGVEEIRVLAVEPHARAAHCLLHVEGFCLQS